MSLHKKVKEIIFEILKDGEMHSIEEIKMVASQNGVEIEQGNPVIRNVVYRLKQEYPNFTSPERGKYKMNLDNQNTDEFDTSSFKQAIEIVSERIDQLRVLDWRICPEVDLKLARRDTDCLKKISEKIDQYLGGKPNME